MVPVKIDIGVIVGPDLISGNGGGDAISGNGDDQILGDGLAASAAATAI